MTQTVPTLDRIHSLAVAMLRDDQLNQAQRNVLGEILSLSTQPRDRLEREDVAFLHVFDDEHAGTSYAVMSRGPSLLGYNRARDRLADRLNGIVPRSRLGSMCTAIEDEIVYLAPSIRVTDGGRRAASSIRSTVL
jgi:hypothetical protein